MRSQTLNAFPPCASRIVGIKAWRPSRFLGLSLALWLAACAPPVADIEADTANDTGDVIEDEPVVFQTARGVSIEELAAYQSVRVALMEDGELTTSHVPLIAHKEALIRTYVSRDEHFEDRDITARLTLNPGTENAVAYFDTHRVAETWDEAYLSTTFNFTVPAEQMTPGLSYVVDLLEPETESFTQEPLGLTQYPVEDSAILPMVEAGGPLTLYVLPIRYQQDGVERLPYTSTYQMENLAERLATMYPTPSVEIEVLDPFDWDQTVSSNGLGWGALLNAVQSQRDAQNIPHEAYLYGMVNPDDTLADYCRSGCMLGLSNLSERAGDAWARSSIGIGFNHEQSIDTLVHELGHAHGRWHSPCGNPSGVDPYYPHGGGGIGAWGYDASRGKIMNPSDFADFMSYCDPNWISDYTYIELLERAQETFDSANWAQASNATTRWQSLIVDETGQTQMGAILSSPHRSNPIPVQVWTTRGVQTVQGHFSPYSHLPGGLLLVPEGLGTILGAAF